MTSCWGVLCFVRRRLISCGCTSFLSEKDCDQLLVLASDLYNILEDNNCLGKHFRQRSIVLKVIFRLLDAEDTKLLLKVARLILAVSVPIFW